MYKHYHDIQIDEAFAIITPEKCVPVVEFTPGVEILEDKTLSVGNPDWEIVTGYPVNMENNGILKPEVLLTDDLIQALHDDNNDNTVFAMTSVFDLDDMDVIGFVILKKNT